MTKTRILTSLLVLALLLPPAVLAQAGRIPVPAREGMVASSHHLASRAGSEVLRRGGNAVDAAIAVSLALGVVEPYASGIGGEGYLVAVLADGREVAVDFRSTAPAMQPT